MPWGPKPAASRLKTEIISRCWMKFPMDGGRFCTGVKIISCIKKRWWDSFFRQVGEIYQGLLAGNDWPVLWCCDKEHLVGRSIVCKTHKVIFPPYSTQAWSRLQHCIQHPRKNRDQLETALKRAVRMITGQANTCYEELRFDPKGRLGEDTVNLTVFPFLQRGRELSTLYTHST